MGHMKHTLRSHRLFFYCKSFPSDLLNKTKIHPFVCEWMHQDGAEKGALAPPTFFSMWKIRIICFWFLIIVFLLARFEQDELQISSSCYCSPRTAYHAESRCSPTDVNSSIWRLTLRGRVVLHMCVWGRATHPQTHVCLCLCASCWWASAPARTQY